MKPPRYPWNGEFKFTDDELGLIDRVNAFLTQPRSVRWIYYSIWDEPDADKEKLLSKVLSKGRKDHRELIPRDMVVDDTRNPTIWHSNQSLEEMIAELYYRRDVWQNQPEYLEVWMEDQASIQSVVRSPRRIFQRYLMNARFCKGFNSIGAMWSAYKFFKKIDKPIRILYYGDLNPSGWAIPIIVVRQFEEMGLDITLDPCALNPEQLIEFDIEAFTKVSGDPRRPEFNKIFGCQDWEDEPLQEYRDKATGRIKRGKRHLNIDLEKIPPDTFEDILDRDISDRIDHDALQETEGEQDEERERLVEIKSEYGGE